MKLIKPNSNFINQILKEYDREGGNQLNKKLKQLFDEFSDFNDEAETQIKVAVLNKLYSTSIVNIKPVVKKIITQMGKGRQFDQIQDYVNLVDNIATVEWKNNKGLKFIRSNLSFASKYVHFISNYETPIYDSYIWIVMKGLLGQYFTNEFNFSQPKSYKDFYSQFELFKIKFKLNNWSNYNIDKFLWQYGRKILGEIENELNISLSESKQELKRRIKAN